MFNVKGQKVKQIYRCELPSGRHMIEMNEKKSSDLAPGIYFLQVKTEAHTDYHKVIKFD